MNPAEGMLNRRIVPALTALSENTYLSAIRAGMVSVVPLTIIGGLFIIVSYLPVAGWDKLVAPYLQLLQIPVTATFGLLSVFVCFAIGFDLGKQLKQEAMVSATIATLVFLMLQLQLKDSALNMESLGSKGLFTAVIIALVSVRVQKFFTDKNMVIRLPENVPPIVYESFLSLSPLFFLVLVFWLIRFVLGVDIDHAVQTAFKPLVFALNTLPGILVYAFLVTLLWSVGINGDNAMDAVVAPIFLQYLAFNVEAKTHGQPLPFITAYGFFTAFVNVGGTGATIALALVMWNSKEPGYRKISRLSLPTQIFQINEPIFFGFPIVLNPLFMIPYILNAMILTTGSYLLMHWNVIHKPFVNVPWTTPPIIGHYLVSGGDWKAAVWGALSIVIAMLVYLPFAKAAERQRLKAEATGVARE
ncbi:MAG TPA: PTS transporter subunit EIIC [Verrucomicrobiae bacterium]|nr:PTS transporter subunit EIIC [Verrucomicrobiae bacterium]